VHDLLQVDSEVLQMLGFSEVVLELKRKILRFKHIFIPVKIIPLNKID
jgi:hypothetical protein